MRERKKTGPPRQGQWTMKIQLSLRTVVTVTAPPCRLVEDLPVWTPFEHLMAIWLKWPLKHSCSTGNWTQLEEAEHNKGDCTKSPPTAPDRAATSFSVLQRMTSSQSFWKTSSIASTMSFLKTMLNSISYWKYNALQSFHVVNYTSARHTDASLNRNGNSVTACLIKSSFIFSCHALDVACRRALNAASSTVHLHFHAATPHGCGESLQSPRKLRGGCSPTMRQKE